VEDKVEEVKALKMKLEELNSNNDWSTTLFRTKKWKRYLKIKVWQLLQTVCLVT
jgi:hypothetical protein